MSSNIIIENARIAYKNFSGKEGKFNPPGRRNFCVLLDDKKLVDQLTEDGWNIRYLKPRDDQESQQAYLQVAVSFANFPPKIVVVSSNGKTVLDEESVNLLDWADIENVDLVIRPYNWDVNGKKGVKGYVKTMYAKIFEDVFESKYLDGPDSAADSIGGCGHCDECDGSCHNH